MHAFVKPTSMFPGLASERHPLGSCGRESEGTLLFLTHAYRCLDVSSNLFKRTTTWLTKQIVVCIVKCDQYVAHKPVCANSILAPSPQSGFSIFGVPSAGSVFTEMSDSDIEVVIPKATFRAPVP